MSVALRTALWMATAAGATLAALSLDGFADRSFAWHMFQHLLLLYAVAPSLLLARPFDAFARIAGKRATAAAVRATRPVQSIALPPVALCILVAALWATHFSPLYESALEHPWPHAVEHALYLGAGIAFWLPLLAPPPLRPLAFPARLLYLIVSLPQGALLGMVIASAREPLYPHYAVAAGSRAVALADQANAAAVMWLAGGLVVFAALLATLAAWARRESDDVPVSRRFAS